MADLRLRFELGRGRYQARNLVGENQEEAALCSSSSSSPTQTGEGLKRNIKTMKRSFCQGDPAIGAQGFGPAMGRRGKISVRNKAASGRRPGSGPAPRRGVNRLRSTIISRAGCWARKACGLAERP